MSIDSQLVPADIDSLLDAALDNDVDAGARLAAAAMGFDPHLRAALDAVADPRWLFLYHWAYAGLGACTRD